MSTQPKLSAEQQSIIRDELNRILADSHFSSSKRCAKLLGRLVELALTADHHSIKERTLGVEVFGREPDYDTNLDPVVRMAASEIRKRLAQFYQESELLSPVAIRLIPGSYLLEFEFGGKGKPNASESLLAAPDPAHLGLPTRGEATLPAAKNLAASRSWRLGGTLALIAILAAAAGSPLLLRGRYMHWGSLRDFPQFSQWKPFFDAAEPVILCISDTEQPQGPQLQKSESASQASAAFTPPPALAALRASSDPHDLRIDFDDANTAHKITSLLSDFGQKSLLRPSSFLNTREFQSEPSIFIGGLNNPWSQKILSPLRFSLRYDPHTGDRWIQDAQNPAKLDWKTSGNAKQLDVDYGVIACFFNQETQQWSIVLAGLHPYGTAAAGDLMTRPSLANLIPDHLRKNKNFQIVVQTHIVNGIASGPQVIATHSW